MRKKHYKGRCEKRVISKCEGVCRTYDTIQAAYVDVLQAYEEISEIRCNVLLDDLVKESKKLKIALNAITTVCLVAA